MGDDGPDLGRARDGSLPRAARQAARGRPRRKASLEGVQPIAHAFARIRGRPTERLVQRGGEGELVGAHVGPLAAELLGRQIRQRPGDGTRTAACIVDDGEAEVRDPRASVGADEDVLGLDVVVHDPGVVHGLQALPGRAEQSQELARAQPGARRATRAS